jgi:hypothetical protein
VLLATDAALASKRKRALAPVARHAVAAEPQNRQVGRGYIRSQPDLTPHREDEDVCDDADQNSK